MSQETIKKVWVCGIYNWEATSTKEIRRKFEYPRHNWADIDTTDIEYYYNTLAVFRKYNIDCFSQRCGKGWHFFGELVEYPIWQKVWDEVRPFADPRWAPHTLRLSKKRKDEVWERPIYHKHEKDPSKFAKAVMSFLCKELRQENSTNLWHALHQTGVDKYVQPTVYQVELK